MHLPFAGNEFAAYDAYLGNDQSQEQHQLVSYVARHHSGCFQPAHWPKSIPHNLKYSAIHLHGKPSDALFNNLGHGAASCSSLTGTGVPGSRSPCISRKFDKVKFLGTLSDATPLDRVNDSQRKSKLTGQGSELYLRGSSSCRGLMSDASSNLGLHQRFPELRSTQSYLMSLTKSVLLED